ncbi:MAG: chorismate mutase [Potamolinea sp.]
MKQLEPFRKKIDDLDLQIIELLGQRFDICRQVAHLKKAENIPMMQSGRS